MNRFTNIKIDDNYQQMMMMMMYPIISSMVGSVCQSLVGDIRNIIFNIFKTLFGIFTYVYNVYILDRFNKPNELHIHIYSETGSMKYITDEGRSLVWYLNTTTMLEKNSIVSARLHDSTNTFKKQQGVRYNGYSKSELNNKESIYEYMYIPHVMGMYNSKQTEQNVTTNKKSIDGDNGEQIFNEIKITTKNELTNGIFVDFTRQEIVDCSRKTIDVYAILSSTSKSLSNIGDFYKGIQLEFDKQKREKGKIFMYNGTDSIDKYSIYQIDPSQTFDNIFTQHKQEIIEEIDNMANISFFKKYGIKRKLSHCYVGSKGSGKTCLSTCIAQYTNRNIVCIPITRITTNKELLDIIYERNINGVVYDMNEVIFVIDEIDSLKTDTLTKSATTTNDKNNAVPNIIVNTHEKPDMKSVISNESSDKLNIGLFLNMLDGNIDQDNMILISTATCVDSLDSGIYRNGRMKYFKCEYMGRDEIVEMLEYYFETILTKDQCDSINDSKTVQSLTIKNKCLSHIIKNKTNDILIDEVISSINSLSNL